MRQTPLQKLVELHLGRDLQAYITAGRAQGKDWRTLAEEISTKTGLSVSHESLRQWFREPAVSAKGA